EGTGRVLERVLEVGSKFSSNSLEPLVRLAISMDSCIEALLAHLLKLLTNLKLRCHLILRGLGDGTYMLHCTINVKCICCGAQFGKCQAFCAPAHKEGSRLEPSASSLRAVPHQRSQGIGRTPLRGRINKERNKVGSSSKAG